MAQTAPRRTGRTNAFKGTYTFASKAIGTDASGSGGGDKPPRKDDLQRSHTLEARAPLVEYLEHIYALEKVITIRRMRKISRRLRAAKKENLKPMQRLFAQRGNIMDMVHNPQWTTYDFGRRYYLQEPGIANRLHPSTPSRKRKKPGQTASTGYGAYAGRLPGLLGQCSRGARRVKRPCRDCGAGKSPFHSCRQVRWRYDDDTQLLWGGACSGCVFQRSKQSCSLYDAAMDHDNDIDGILAGMDIADIIEMLTVPAGDDGDWAAGWGESDDEEGLGADDSTTSSSRASVSPELLGDEGGEDSEGPGDGDGDGDEGGREVSQSL